MTTQEKIPCSVGLQMLAALRDKTDTKAVILAFKGVERPEQLTREELVEMTELSRKINAAVLSPRSVEAVKLEFTITVQGVEYLVCLPEFSELDITLQAVEMLEDFNPTQVERIPLMIGCVYAPIVRAMFGFPIEDAKLAHIIAEGIKEHADFADVFAVYDFFVLWKVTSMTEPRPSFRHLLRLYRRRRRQTRFLRKLTARYLRTSRKASPTTSSDTNASTSIAGTSSTRKSRLRSAITRCLPKWSSKGPKE